MLRLSSPIMAAALGALALAGAAPAQEAPTPTTQPADTQSNAAAPPPTIGSPLLRDFQLEGTRTTPPANDPAPAEPARTAPVQTQPAREAPAPVTAARRPAEREVAPAPQPAPTPDQSTTSAPSVAAPLDTLPLPEPAPADDLAPAPEQQPTLAPAAASPDYTLWIAGAAALLLLLGFAWFRSRKSAEPAMARAALPEASAPTPRPAAPRPVPAAAPKPAAETAPRPWLEIEFKPEKLVATDKDTSVHFQLLVKNDGESEARNVRITAKMFNPSADQKELIKAFFATPPKAGGQPISIPPKLAARFKPSVVMPRESIKVLEVQGRPIFVPTVAINIQYEWGDGRKGQTCKSFLVGTEKEGAASQKMGAFRLDLGPRIYRHVGGRPLELARAV